MAKAGSKKFVILDNGDTLWELTTAKMPSSFFTRNYRGAING